MFMVFHAIMADIKTDEFVLAPEISDVSDGKKEEEFITFMWAIPVVLCRITNIGKVTVKHNFFLGFL